jgi:hypothetical protein
MTVNIVHSNMKAVLNSNATFAPICNSNLIVYTSSQEKEIVIYKTETESHIFNMRKSSFLLTD